jgi:protein SCO1
MTRCDGSDAARPAGNLSRHRRVRQIVGRRLDVAVLVVIVITGLGMTGCAPSETGADNPAGVRVHTTPDARGFRGSVLPEPYTKPRLSFVDTGNRSFEFAGGTAGKPVTLVFFGYTYCPDVCNTVLADLASALRRVKPEVRDRVQVVFITTDPKRDTPAVIRKYLDRFDPSFIGLTGPLPVIERAARSMGVYLTRPSRLPGGGYEVGHGAQVIGFGSDGKAHVIWSPGTSVGDLRHDFTKLAEAA